MGVDRHKSQDACSKLLTVFSTGQTVVSGELALLYRKHDNTFMSATDDRQYTLKPRESEVYCPYSSSNCVIS